MDYQDGKFLRGCFHEVGHVVVGHDVGRNGNELDLSKECQGAKALAVSLMARHGLFGWLFGFNKNLRRAGVCFYPGKKVPGRIELSIHFVKLNSEEEIRDTILHEIAHALSGSKHGHDEVWKATCLKIGAKPERCYGEGVNMPKGRWQATCPSCNKLFHRHRRPQHHLGWHCRTCGKERGRLIWGC